MVAGCSTRCNTVPIEKGTETNELTRRVGTLLSRCNTVPIEKGTETHQTLATVSQERPDATPSPSRRGLKLRGLQASRAARSESNTVPIEKGTETEKQPHQQLLVLLRSNTVPIEKGTETLLNNGKLRIQGAESNTVPIEKGTETSHEHQCGRRSVLKQHRPHREGD